MLCAGTWRAARAVIGRHWLTGAGRIRLRISIASSLRLVLPRPGERSYGVVADDHDQRPGSDPGDREGAGELDGQVSDAGGDARRQRHEIYGVGEVDPVLYPDLGTQQP